MYTLYTVQPCRIGTACTVSPVVSNGTLASFWVSFL